MNGSAFKLGTFATPNGDPFAAIVLGNEAVDLTRAYEIYRGSARRKALSSTSSILGLLQNWEANFPVLQDIVALLEKEGLKAGAADLSGLRALPPVLRPGKMFYAAQNFQEHVDEMIRAGMSPAGGPRFTGEKSATRPYLFLKAPSCLAGANDDIEIPLGMTKIDWEAEIALAIGKRGKRSKAEHALGHVAGFMTTNDVSCRDLLVPRVFVPDHMNLFIRLTVNGAVKQNGNTSQFIFTPEEQIEYASGILSLEPGDVFSCGTCGGVGQGTNTFLKPGDLMETEIESLGRMRNRLVAESAQPGAA